MKKIIIISLFAVFLLGCQEDPVLWTVDSTQQVIAEYITDREEFSEFARILEETGLHSLLSVRGPFTMFLPNDSIMEIYYADMGKSSLDDFSVEEMEQLAMNHMVPAFIGTGDVGLGALGELNGLGDYLVTEFSGSDIIVNKKSMIVKRDIEAANGVIHHIDKVIEPVYLSIYDAIAQDPAYSIFTEGLDLTRLKDTLNVISFPYGQGEARTRFTLLAVADTTFANHGINNVDELIDWTGGHRDSLDIIEDEFYRYMEYHCLGGTYYLNTFETSVYPILSYDNNMTMTIADDYKLNLDQITEEYTGFYVELSNNPSKNGTIHTIDDLLPVFEPEPQTFVWETTDYFDLKQGDYFGKYYMRWFDGENTFEYIKWEGDYMLYYFKDHNTGKLMNHDCLSMSGWWWVQVTTPKIMKGKYTLFSNLWSGQISYTVWVDGVQTAFITSDDPAESTPWGTFDWTETERHTLKVVAKTPGLLFWDTLIFEPAD